MTQDTKSIAAVRHQNRRNTCTGFFALAVSLALPFQASAACFRGINIAGAEFGALGGAYNTEYAYPKTKTIQYFASTGLNTVRLPFRWERLQPALNGPLDPTELGRLAATVKAIRANGMEAILDVHNYGRYHDQPIGSSSVPTAAFADLWSKLATVFANQKGVSFGLMNEPHDMKVKIWLASANAATAAIRATGAQNLILVPGSTWTGAHSWLASTNDGNNSRTMLSFVDPANNYAFEVHQYLDQDYSGTHSTCSGAAGALAGLKSFTNWLKANGKRGFLGEFGAGNSDACVTGLSQMIAIVNSEPSVWTGWAYWAGGDRWPADYILSVQPAAGRERPQMGALISPQALAGDSCAGLP